MRKLNRATARRAESSHAQRYWKGSGYVNVTKKHARAVIPGDRLVFRNRNADRVWHERVIGVRHAPICQGVIIKTRRDGETIGELRLNPHDEVEVVDG